MERQAELIRLSTASMVKLLGPEVWLASHTGPHGSACGHLGAQKHGKLGAQ